MVRETGMFADEEEVDCRMFADFVEPWALNCRFRFDPICRPDVVRNARLRCTEA
jgi:hypothetical protein